MVGDASDRRTDPDPHGPEVPFEPPVGFRSLDPRVLRLWHLEAGLWWLLTSLVLGAVALLVAQEDGAGPVVAVLLGTIATGLVLALVLPRWHYRTWRYEVGDEGLGLEHGVVFRISSVTPYRRIQLVDIASGPLERSLGLGHLVLHTASATTDAEVPGIPLDEADQLRSLILGRAGVGDAV